jgi:hypothetical protein
MFSALNNSLSPAVCFQLFKILINPRDTQKKKKEKKSPDESLDSFMKKKERVRLATKTPNCVVVVAGVVCQNGGQGGEYLYSYARGRTPLYRRPQRST